MALNSRHLMLPINLMRKVCATNLYLKQACVNQYTKEHSNFSIYEPAVMVPLATQKRNAGHSKWANIKFKKMHKDNARAKIFGKLSLEIIQVVKENGPDPNQNSKLESLILKAKSCSMPKDKIETSIKNAQRGTDAKRSRLLLQVRGPGKCGLLIDALSPNVLRTKPEIKSILKRNGATLIEDGSVVFMFEHKGVITVQNNYTGTAEYIKEEAEEIAIVIGAEDVHVTCEEEQKNVFQFFCPPLEVLNLKKELTENYETMGILSADAQYLAKTTVELSDDAIVQADKLIDSLADHPDVIQVYDNITGYPSKTIKLINQLEGFT